MVCTLRNGESCESLHRRCLCSGEVPTGEELSDKAGSLLRRFHGDIVELKAPGLVRCEVGNTLWKAVRQRKMGSHEASEKLSQSSSSNWIALNWVSRNV
jgi:predicted nucleic acid-binding protein